MFITTAQKKHISNGTKITKTRFMGSIPSEWKSFDGSLRVVFNKGQFLGGGIFLYTTDLLYNNKLIVRKSETSEILEAYCKKFLELFPIAQNNLENNKR